MKQFLVAACLLGALFAPTTVNAQTAEQKKAMLTSLERAFDAHRPTSKAEQAAMLNQAASENPGWGTLGKKSGNNCPLADGQLISCDFVVYGPTKRGWDVIASEGAPDMHIGSISGEGEDFTEEFASGSRSFVAPIGGSTPGPGPVTPPPAPTVDLTPLINDIAALRADASQLRQLLEDKQRQLDSANARLDELSNIATGAQSGVVNLKNYLNANPIPDGCRVMWLGCRLSFNRPPVE